MEIKVNIRTENAVFKECPEMEVARILRRLAGELETVTMEVGDGGWLRDINGNTVGAFEVIE